MSLSQRTGAEGYILPVFPVSNKSAQLIHVAAVCQYRLFPSFAACFSFRRTRLRRDAALELITPSPLFPAEGHFLLSLGEAVD